MSTTFQYRSSKLVKAGVVSPVWTFESPLDMSPQDRYSWIKGTNEYMDNYTASVTRAGLVKGSGDKKTVTAWDSPTAYVDRVTADLNEAHARWNAGDVPADGKRATDPKTLADRQRAAEIATLDESDIAEIMALVAAKKAARAAAPVTESAPPAPASDDHPALGKRRGKAA